MMVASMGRLVSSLVTIGLVLAAIGSADAHQQSQHDGDEAATILQRKRLVKQSNPSHSSYPVGYNKGIRTLKSKSKKSDKDDMSMSMKSDKTSKSPKSKSPKDDDLSMSMKSSKKDNIMKVKKSSKGEKRARALSSYLKGYNKGLRNLKKSKKDDDMSMPTSKKDKSKKSDKDEMSMPTSKKAESKKSDKMSMSMSTKSSKKTKNNIKKRRARTLSVRGATQMKSQEDPQEGRGLKETSSYEPTLSSSKFYIYGDGDRKYSEISHSFLLERLRSLGPSAFDYASKSLDHVVTDAYAEFNVLQALEEHPLRTYNPEDADLYIVPTPITELLLYGCRWEDCTWYDESIMALTEHPIFRKTGGHNHVMISFNWLSFSHKFQAFIPALSRNYKYLQNVTVAHHFDPFGSMELAASPDVDSQYKALFPEETPVTNAFSIGLGLGYDETFPIQEASYEKFESSKNFVFYHTSDRDFHYGSTKYRKALLHEDLANAGSSPLPASSIGTDVDYETWVEGIMSSKFCLVVRGDTPHSHALFAAVRAGCIPVVVSDYYSTYAPPFKSSLTMEDFCIFIKEADFADQKDALTQVLALEKLDDSFIRDKLHNLRVAQKILMPDHQESLFVEAFMKEAQHAIKSNKLPDLYPNLNVQALDDSVILSGTEYRYKYPSTMSVDSSYKKMADGGKTLIVGVLSAAGSSDGYNARLSIRQTWAEDRKGQVFFILAGPWEDVAEEYFAEGDIFWVDAEEEWDLLSIKSQAFLHAVETHGGAYDYVMKTDDDSYVGLAEVERILNTYNPDYWGYCMFNEKYRHPFRDPSAKYFVSKETFPGDLYPVWAQGLGYVLSRKFNECAQTVFKSMKYMPMEDLSVGIAAEQCNVACSRDEWKSWDETGHIAPMRLEHHIKQSDEMLYTHWKNMRLMKVGEFSEFE